MNNLKILEQQLFVGVLKQLPDHVAKELLKESNFGVGLRGQFYYHCAKWVQVVGKPNDNQCEQHPIRKTSDLQPSQSSTPPPTPSQLINLNDILKVGPYGPGVVQHYKKYGCLNEKVRKLLLEACLFYCANNNLSATKSNCQSLAFQIRDTFQGELAVSA